MNTVLSRPEKQDFEKISTRPLWPNMSTSDRPHTSVSSRVFNDLAEELFASLPRSDQRGKALDYLLGLLHTPGRKSIRNMATLFGDTAVSQSLHHFICSSTWDWTPVRQTLAVHVARRAVPQAWVVRPLVIPKGGPHSVGVTRYFSSAEGQVINGQRAVGVWLASERACVPVELSLHLPDNADQASRHGTRALEPYKAQTLAASATDACLRMRSRWGVPPRPVVLDLGGEFPVEALLRLRASGLLPVARVTEDLELRVADPALTGHIGQYLPAERIMRAAHNLRRPEEPLPNTPSEPGQRPSLLAAVRVNVPGSPGEQLTLVGSGPGDKSWPGELWLTPLPPNQAVTAVPEARRQVDRVDRSLSEVGDGVGIRDYAGRSYNGWHRHITLASVAHTISVLSA